MTVAHESTKVSHSGDDATSEFAFAFKIFEESDLKVVVIDTDDVEHTLPYDIYNYTLTGELGKFESGGTVALLYDNAGSMDPWLIPTGWTVVLSLDMTYDQPTDLLYGGTYSSDALERMIDRTVKMLQQLLAYISDLELAGEFALGAWGIPTEVTIASGIAAIGGEGFYSIDTEGDAGSDNLTQITGLNVGDEIILMAANDARTVVVKNGANLILDGSADFTLNSIYDRLILQSIGSDKCVELNRCSPRG